MLAAGALIPLLATGCGRTGSLQASSGRSADRLVTTVSGPTAQRPVAELSLEGGFLRPGLVALRPPRLAVYGDGTAITDAEHQVRLTLSEVNGLVAALSRDLAGQPPTASPRPGTPEVMDAPTVVFSVSNGGRTQTVKAPAMEALQSGQAYAPALQDAYDRLVRLADRARKQGTPYTSARIRLVAERGASDGRVRQWPRGVPVPDSGRPSGAAAKDLSGMTAQQVIRVVPRDESQRGAWAVFRSPAGAPLSMSWRFLLPGE
jgi:hypothetical protein